jgi:hypothetical protein
VLRLRSEEQVMHRRGRDDLTIRPGRLDATAAVTAAQMSPSDYPCGIAGQLGMFVGLSGRKLPMHGM